MPSANVRERAASPLMQRLDVTLPPDQRARMAAFWHRGRIVVAALFATSGLICAQLWAWPAGYVVAGLAAVSMTDAIIRHRMRWRDSVFVSVLIDVTIIHFAMGVAGVLDSAVGIPFAYVVLSSLLLLRLVPASISIVYAAVWFTAVVRDWVPTGVELPAERAIVSAVITDALFAAGFVGLITVMLRIISRDRRRRQQQSRLQTAITTASNALLTASGDDPLEGVLTALLDATDATAVFVEKNVDHPRFGLCSSLIIEVLNEGVGPDPADLWKMVPWDQLSGREILEAGGAHRLRTSELEGDESRLYADTEIQSEIDIPIFVNGAWWGLIGFTDVSQERPWSAQDEQLLFTAAELIGAYIERTGAREELDRIIVDLDQQVRYQHALAESAAALLATGTKHALDTALAALLRATDADYAYIDVNYDDPKRGLCARVVHDADTPGSPQPSAKSEWWGGPYAELPTSFAALSNGRPAQIVTSELEGREREIYEADGIKSELCIPIEVAGKWRGSIAFADYQEERNWTALEVRALRTAAVMIGTYWERDEARERLEELVGSQERRLRYERAISSCSQVLLASGDDSAIDQAIAHLQEATGAHSVFVDVNELDPSLGVVARVTHEVIQPGMEDVVDPEIWVDHASGERHHARIAYSSLPTLRAALERGVPSFVFPRLLAAEERAVYGEAGCKSELNIPIMTSGTWVGAIGLADYLEERTWDADEISLLQTAGEMIGSFWERNEAHARLEEMVHSKDEFVAAVSHELRTPLTSVVGLAEELRDRRSDFTDEEAASFIHMIAEQSTEVADIVNDLLVAARSDTGTLIVDTQPVVVREAFEAVMRAGLDHSFDSVEFTGADVKVAADAGRLRQILRNLIVNASRYGGSNLRASVTMAGSVATISVADDGPGIADEHAARIFEPYGRAHHHATQPASVGLGLAVARQLAQLMDGDLTYQRSADWTVFALTLPVATDSARSRRH